MEQFPRDFPPQKYIGWTSGDCGGGSGQFSCAMYVNANPNHGVRRTTITGSNGREKRRKNFNGSVFKDPQPSRASRRPLLRTMQKPTRVNATVDGEGARRGATGEKKLVALY